MLRDSLQVFRQTRLCHKPPKSEETKGASAAAKMTPHWSGKAVVRPPISWLVCIQRVVSKVYSIGCGGGEGKVEIRRFDGCLI